MNNTEAKESFEKNWEEFLTKLKGQMLRQKDNNLTLDLLSSVLKEVLASWRSEYDILGRWLIDYTKQNEQKGKEISVVIFEDMKFEEVKIADNSNKKMLDILPWAAAAVGFGASYFLKASQVIQAVATILPPAVLIPLTNNVKNEYAIQKKRNQINDYLTQLDKYKNTIISIIERE